MAGSTGDKVAKKTNAKSCRAEVIDIATRRQHVLDRVPVHTREHAWLLPVMDTLIDYCDENDMPRSADKLRRLLGTLVQEALDEKEHG